MISTISGNAIKEFYCKKSFTLVYRRSDIGFQKYFNVTDNWCNDADPKVKDGKYQVFPTEDKRRELFGFVDNSFAHINFGVKKIPSNSLAAAGLALSIIYFICFTFIKAFILLCIFNVFKTSQ